MTARKKLTDDERRVRDEQIRKLAVQGNTLEEIGEIVDLTRERVRQIISEYWPSLVVVRREKSQGIRKATSDLNRQEQADQRVAAIAKALAANGNSIGSAIENLKNSRSIKTTSKSLGVTEEDLEFLADASHEEFSFVKERNSSGSKYTDLDLLAYIKLTADALSTEVLSTKQYWNYASIQLDQKGVWPSHQTILKRFGTWSEACQSAGISAGKRRRSEYVRNFPSDVCRRELDRFLSVALDGGTRATSVAYDNWARTSEAPSLSTLRNQLGVWDEIKAASLGRISRKNESLEGAVADRGIDD